MHAAYGGHVRGERGCRDVGGECLQAAFDAGGDPLAEDEAGGGDRAGCRVEEAVGLAAAHPGVGQDEMGEAVLGGDEGPADALGGAQINVVVGRAEHSRRSHPAEVQQPDPGRGGGGHQPRRAPRTDAVTGDGQPREPSVRRAFQGVGEEEGAGVPQPGGGYVEFVDRARRDDGGEGCGAVRAERVAADEEPLDAAPIAGSGEQRVSKDDCARRIDPGLHEVERAQRPRGLDEFGRRPPSPAAQRVALEPHPGDDLRRGPQLVRDPTGTTGRYPVAAEIERLDVPTPRGHDLGTLVPEPVGTEQQVPYRRGPLGQRLGDQRGTLRPQLLLAQVEPPVGQGRAYGEVEALSGRSARPQPVEQRGQFGDGSGHDVRDTGEGDRRRRWGILPRIRSRRAARIPGALHAPAHHAASR